MKEKSERFKGRKRKLKMSDEMRNILDIMRSPIAEFLLDIHDFTNYADYLSVGEKNGERMVSFVPYPCNMDMDQSNPPKRRELARPGKVARALIMGDKFTQHDYEMFSNEFRGVSENSIDFRVGKTGIDFKFAYNEENYFKMKGTLGNSCMKREICGSFVRSYVDFGAEILIGTINGLVVSRAILWHTDEDVFLLDRIYAISDAVKEATLKWAIDDYGIDCWKECDSYSEPEWITPDIYGTKFSVSCKSVDYVPYMDTFKYLVETGRGGFCLYNYYPEIDEPCTIYTLEGTEGYESCTDVYEECGSCGCVENTNNMTEIGRAYYCDDCIVTDGITHDSVVRDDAQQYIDYYGDEQFTLEFDQLVFSADGCAILRDYAVEDYVDGKIYYDDDARIFEFEDRDNPGETLYTTHSEMLEMDDETGIYYLTK